MRHVVEVANKGAQISVQQLSGGLLVSRRDKSLDPPDVAAVVLPTQETHAKRDQEDDATTDKQSFAAARARSETIVEARADSASGSDPRLRVRFRRESFSWHRLCCATSRSSVLVEK